MLARTMKRFGYDRLDVDHFGPADSVSFRHDQLGGGGGGGGGGRAHRLEHLEEAEQQPEIALDLDGQIAKDEETTVCDGSKTRGRCGQRRVTNRIDRHGPSRVPVLSMSLRRCSEDTSVPASAF